MANSLHTLIRLHQHRVDEKRRELGGMLAVVSDLERQAAALREALVATKGEREVRRKRRRTQRREESERERASNDGRVCLRLRLRLRPRPLIHV